MGDPRRVARGCDVLRGHPDAGALCRPAQERVRGPGAVPDGQRAAGVGGGLGAAHGALAAGPGAGPAGGEGLPGPGPAGVVLAAGAEEAAAGEARGEDRRGEEAGRAACGGRRGGRPGDRARSASLAGDRGRLAAGTSLTPDVPAYPRTSTVLSMWKVGASPSSSARGIQFHRTDTAASSSWPTTSRAS